MEEKNFISGDYLKILTQSLESIGASLMNLINITNNLIPEDLHKYGLKHCLTKIFEALQSDYQKNIIFAFYGNFIRLDESTEANIFNITNSLISFILAQSQPDIIEVNITQNKDWFHVEVLDNGKEFNISNISSSGINDLAELKSNVEAFNGSFSFIRIDTNHNKLDIKLKLFKAQNV
jgi:signal transduction histidine kinase